MKTPAPFRGRNKGLPERRAQRRPGLLRKMNELAESFEYELTNDERNAAVRLYWNLV
jgi:hypothetical protein